MTKNQAMSELNQKSRSLKKVMQPRLAYKYKTGAGSNNASVTRNDGFMNMTQMNSSRELARYASRDSGGLNGSFATKFAETGGNQFEKRSRSIAAGGASANAPASGQRKPTYSRVTSDERQLNEPSESNELAFSKTNEKLAERKTPIKE